MKGHQGLPFGILWKTLPVFRIYDSGLGLEMIQLVAKSSHGHGMDGFT